MRWVSAWSPCYHTIKDTLFSFLCRPVQGYLHEKFLKNQGKCLLMLENEQHQPMNEKGCLVEAWISRRGKRRIKKKTQKKKQLREITLDPFRWWGIIGINATLTLSGHMSSTVLPALGFFFVVLKFYLYFCNIKILRSILFVLGARRWWRRWESALRSSMGCTLA